jgi:hypothetical protein
MVLGHSQGSQTTHQPPLASTASPYFNVSHSEQLMLLSNGGNTQQSLSAISHICRKNLIFFLNFEDFFQFLSAIVNGYTLSEEGFVNIG